MSEMSEDNDFFNLILELKGELFYFDLKGKLQHSKKHIKLYFFMFFLDFKIFSQNDLFCFYFNFFTRKTKKEIQKKKFIILSVKMKKKIRQKKLKFFFWDSDLKFLFKFL